MDYETFAEARRALERGETSCEDLVSGFLERIDERNETLNALLTVDADGALNHARYLDSQQERGNGRPLTGLVVAVKDNICIKGGKVTCGSRMLEEFESRYNATVIERLREAGAIFIGKANCDEFAMGSSNETSHFGPVHHPQHEEYVPGGSSGGSAAAVAAGFCHAALGSDTGGSIRQPASFCGIAGLKPTYGRVSRSGLVAYASSLDTIGPMTRTVEDAALMLKAIAGQDPADATSASVPVPEYADVLGRSVEGVRIGLPEEYFGEDLDDGVRAVIEKQVEQLKDAGAEVRDVSLPHTEYALAAYYLLATAEASSNLARYDGVRFGHRADIQEKTPVAAGEHGVEEASADGQDDRLERLYAETRSAGFGKEVKRRIMLGTYALSAGYHEQYYEKAQKVRTLLCDDFEQAFEEVDVLLTPTTPRPPFKRGARADEPMAMYRGDRYTVAANLAGLPGLSVPAGSHPEAPHLPVGLQLLAPHFDEATLVQVGDAVMRS